MNTTITIQNGQIITTTTSTIDVATYVAQQQSAIDQYNANISSLQAQIDDYAQKMSDTQALIDQAQS